MDDFSTFSGMDASPEDVEMSKHFRTRAKEENWESSVSLKVMRALGLRFSERDLLDASEDHSGVRRISFAGLDALVPELPLRFVSSRESDAHRKTSLAEELTRSLLYKKWQEAFEVFGDSKALGLVFPWTNFGTCVLHNRAPDLTQEGCIHVRTFRRGRLVLSIEKLTRLLASVKSELWPRDE